MPKTPPRRALIVIDVQNEYVSGRLCIEFPPVEDSLRHIADAMAVATSNGIPIVTVQQTAPPDAPLFAQGSEGWQLHAVMAGQDADHRVEKTLPSALRGTNLEAWLRERDIDTLTLAGYMTHNCVLSTAIDAAQAGFVVEVLADASGSVPYANEAGTTTAEILHRTICVLLQSRFAAVAPTQAWIEHLACGQALPRSNIFASNQAAPRLRAGAVTLS